MVAIGSRNNILYVCGMLYIIVKSGFFIVVVLYCV